MNGRIENIRRLLKPVDLALIAAGLMGLLVYFLLFPSQDPDSAASFALGEERAVEIAEAFAEGHGLDVPEDAATEVVLHREEEYLEALQSHLGRPRAVQALHEDSLLALPAYHWHVTWTKEMEDADDIEVDVTLTEGGGILSVETTSLPDSSEVNYEALAAASPAPGSVQQGAASPARLDSTGLRNLFSTESGAAIDSAALVRLARYYVDQTALDIYSLGVDSIWRERESGMMTFGVLFGERLFEEHYLSVDVNVSPKGNLLQIETSTTDEAVGAPDEVEVSSQRAVSVTATSEGEVTSEDETVVTASGPSDDDESMASTIANVVTGALYVILALAALFIFFRRISARAVDTKSALRDALWGGLFAAAGMGIPAVGGIAQDGPESVWMLVFIIGVILVFLFAGGAFLIFLASGAMDSVARERWAHKLTTLDLVRHGAIRNMAVGRTLLMGVFGAFALIGATTLLLMLFPGAAIKFSGTEFTLDGGDMFVSVFAFMFAGQAWMAQFIGFTAMLGAGTLLYKWKPKGWFVIGGLTLLLTLMQTTLIPLMPLGMSAIFIAFASLVLAWIFWRYDFVAFCTAIVLSALFMITTTGWMLPDSPLFVDALLTFMLTGVILVMAFVGLLSGVTATSVEEYVPSYIKELAEEQRLRRDLEIAQEVQQSFLPRRMPKVEGLDLAAMCLPAQQVGGDYYDFIEIAPGKLAVVIGDVSGKGIQASFYMTLAKGFVQTLARESLPPVEVLLRINRLFWSNAPRGMFISMIYGVIDVETGVFTFARAGHNPPIIRRAPGERPDFLRPRGLAVGLTDGSIFDVAIEEATLSLHEGDTLVLYTDGFPEAMNAKHEQFGEDRLIRVVHESGERPAHEVMRRISESVYHHVGDAERHDDMTMIVIRSTQPEPEREVLVEANVVAEEPTEFTKSMTGIMEQRDLDEADYYQYLEQKHK